MTKETARMVGNLTKKKKVKCPGGAWASLDLTHTLKITIIIIIVIVIISNNIYNNDNNNRSGNDNDKDYYNNIKNNNNYKNVFIALFLTFNIFRTHTAN